MKLRPFLLAASFLLPAQAAVAGPASEAVAEIYRDLGSEFDPQERDRFTGPARAVLDANDEVAERDGYPCVDFSFAIDAQDFDDDELDRTLELRESVSGDGALVTARFSLFGQPRTIEWTLEREGGAWLVADVMSPEGGWRLGEFSCR